MTEKQFEWKQHPKAEALIDQVLQRCAEENGDIAHLQNELHDQTSTRLFDWLDHVIVGRSKEMEDLLQEVGYVGCDAAKKYRVFTHPGAQLPWVVMRDSEQDIFGIAVNVESISDYLMVRGITREIEGTPLSGYRRCCISTENDVSLTVVERRATRTMEPTHPGIDHVEKYLEASEKWLTRPRAMEDRDEAMRLTLSLAEEIVDSVGEDMAAWIVCEVERRYWQFRNQAGQLQKARQDRLGMGWANHDHHTFRSSRKQFPQLVRLFEMLGFHCRERFYAGEQAGWGAQVMENSRCGLVLFLDVDLDPKELEIDFAHQAIPDLSELGTIGLWCELHGDSILQAGMHHLEAQFFFGELTEDLKKIGVGMMQPFSDFPYLKQAFTEGEIWRVDPWNIRRLLSEGKITKEQADHFSTKGAVGSHLENLQRREGYKGFNKKNVSFIIKKTDPRTLTT